MPFYTLILWKTVIVKGDSLFLHYIVNVHKIFRLINILCANSIFGFSTSFERKLK